MSNYFTELNRLILELADGDDEFRVELISAIYSGLLELKLVYADGVAKMDKVKIQQIRHKIKPTLAMFEFVDLAVTIQEGKDILEQQGFGAAFEVHFQVFLVKVDLALEEVSSLADQIKIISA